MRPPYAAHDVPDSASVDWKTFGDFKLRHAGFVERAYLKHLSICEFYRSGMLSFYVRLPSFGKHIVNVVKRSSGEQVGWMIATWSIAVMAHKETAPRFSIKFLIGKAMRHILSFWRCYVSVSMASNSISPKKAWIISPLLYWVNNDTRKTFVESLKIPMGIKMGRSETCVDSASMPNATSIRDSSVSNLKGHPMGVCTTALVSAETAIPHTLAALPDYAWIVAPLLAVIMQIGNCILQIVKTVNLVTHRRALQWRTVLASRCDQQCGAFFIVTQVPA